MNASFDLKCIDEEIASSVPNLKIIWISTLDLTLRLRGSCRNE